MSHPVANSRNLSLFVASVADVAYADAYADADANNGVRKTKQGTPSISIEGQTCADCRHFTESANSANDLPQPWGNCRFRKAWEWLSPSAVCASGRWEAK